MLPCVCSVIDNRWRQNVVRTKKWHTRRSRVVIDVLTTFWRLLWSITESDEQQHGIYLFYVITKSLFYFKIFQHNAKAGFCPAFAHFGEDEKKPFDVIYYLYKMKLFHWLLCVAKNCDAREKSRHCQTGCQTWCERRFSWNENFQRNQNWTAKSTNLEENAGKIKSVFVIRAALWAEKLGRRCLKNCWSWKNTLGKLVIAVNLRASWFDFWIKGG